MEAKHEHKCVHDTGPWESEHVVRDKLLLLWLTKVDEVKVEPA